MKEQIRRVFFFPLDINYQDEVENNIWQSNRKIFRVMGSVILIIQIFMACSIASRPGGPFIKTRREMYFVMYLSLVGATVLALLAERYVGRGEGGKSYRAFRGMSYAYMCFLCFWSTAITLNDQLGGNGLNVFTYMSLTVSVLGMLRLWQGLLLFVTNFLLLNILLPYFPVPSMADQSFNNLVNSGVTTVFSILISAVVYRNRVMQEYNQIVIRQQYRKIQEMNWKLSMDAVTDHMTGLKNRRYLQEQIKETFRKRAGEGSVACMMLDIDYFKRYNDAHGHQAGDECLKFIADLLKREAKEYSDEVVRFGGEEFTMFFFGKSREEVLEQAERIRGLIEAEDYRTNDRIREQVTISIGICYAGDTKEMTLEEFVDQADRALYRAKNMGRNQVVERDINSEYNQTQERQNHGHKQSTESAG